ncbi:UNVERIFIED_CONTAM: hypothetical protein FKN15_041360 [Acipenser sinensis]
MVKFLFTGACAPLGVWLLITGVTVFRVQAQRLRSRDAGVPVTCRDGYMEVAVTPSEFGGTTITFNIRVTVQCTRDGQVVVVVSRNATRPQLSLNSVGMLGGRNPPCNPVRTSSAFTMFKFPVSACGTTMKRRGSDVVYENLMSAFIDVRTGPGGSITRDSTYKLLLQCQYAGNKSVPLQAVVYTIAPPPPVVAQGPLRVELRIAREQSYGSYYTSLDYPVTYVLREPVYVEVRILERTDTNIVLTLDDCWATSTPSPLGKPQWNLLVDGCSYRDDNYLTSLVPVDAATSRLPNPTHYKRFVLKMFTFVDPASRRALKEMIYIHCSAAVCYPSVMDSCVKRCIAKRHARDAPLQTVRKEASSKQTAVASSGAVILTAPDARALESWDSEGEVNVQCTRDGYMMTAISKAVTKPDLLLNSVSLIGGRNPPCAPVGRSASFLLFKFPLGACGTRLRLADDKVVYENEMSGTIDVLDSRYGSITRDADYKLTIRCLYSAKMALPLQVQIQSVDPPRPVAEQGPLRIELRIARDKAYGSYFADLEYPLVRVLRELVYVEVRLLGRTDTKIHLVLDDCWATSTTSPLSEPRWSLLVDGCPYKEDYNYLTSLIPVDASSGLVNPTHYKRFQLKMFAFVNVLLKKASKDPLFLYCSAAACSPSASDSCTVSCPPGGRFVRQAEFTQWDMVIAHSGPIIFMEAEKNVEVDLNGRARNAYSDVDLVTDSKPSLIGAPFQEGSEVEDQGFMKHLPWVLTVVLMGAVLVAAVWKLTRRTSRETKL